MVGIDFSPRKTSSEANAYKNIRFLVFTQLQASSAADFMTAHKICFPNPDIVVDLGRSE